MSSLFNNQSDFLGFLWSFIAFLLNCVLHHIRHVTVLVDNLLFIQIHSINI